MYHGDYKAYYKGISCSQQAASIYFPKALPLDFLAPLSLRILWLKFLGTTGQVPEMQYLNLQ